MAKVKPIPEGYHSVTHLWTIATHVEDVSPEEMERRSKEAMQSQ
jgi:hypothetical protein